VQCHSVETRSFLFLSVERFILLIYKNSVILEKFLNFQNFVINIMGCYAMGLILQS